MTALAIVEAAVVPAFENWVAECRALVDERKAIDWRLADHIAAGRQTFGHQAGFDFLADSLGLAPKRLKDAEKRAKAFPAHLRAKDVPVEVHARIAALPESERVEVLQRASREHCDEKRAQTEVTQHKAQAAMFEDNDPERLATLIYRAWNNAGPEIREHAWPILEAAANNGFGIADEEVVIDA